MAPFGHDDDGVELHAVAHRDHHVALDVVGRGSDRVEVRRDVGRQRRRLREPALQWLRRVRAGQGWLVGRTVAWRHSIAARALIEAVRL